MANIGIPLLAIDPSMTWCKLRALHEHRARWGVAVGPAMADKKFIDEVVKAHNEYRKRHQAEPLSHNKELSAHAQRWADHLASTGSFQHSDATLKGERLGENIAMKWSSRPDAYTGQEVTDQWYSEIKMHQFGGEPRSLSTGHFTQVVWKGSKEIGVGKGVTRDGKVIVVANYRPAGNMVGSFAANVLPPKDGKIILPAETASKPTTTTTRHTFSSEGAGRGGSSFSQRFEEMKRGFDAPSSHFSSGGFSSTGTRSESRSVRTYTVTEGVGPNKVTKTITEETIIKPDGEKIVNRKETTTGGAGIGSTHPSSLGAGFGHLSLKDSGDVASGKEKDKKKKPFWKRGGSSSSDSSPERGSSKAKDKQKSSSSYSRPQRMSDFQKEILQAHNAARAKHGAPPLTMAEDLNQHAQKWAEELAATDNFAHSKCMVNGERVGENIACKWSSSGADYSGQDAVDQWYSEIKKHNFDSDGAPGSGHFTQVVWKGSKELGVGKAKTSSGKAIVVANYRPAGNMLGTYKENVMRPV